jgi:hypothetical protein
MLLRLKTADHGVSLVLKPKYALSLRESLHYPATLNLSQFLYELRPRHPWPNNFTRRAGSLRHP